MLQSSLCHSPPTTSWLLFTRRRPAPCAMEAWHENGQSCRRGAYRAAALRPAPTRHQADVGQARRAIRQGRLAGSSLPCRARRARDRRSRSPVLIEADTGGEWKVGAHAHEHSPPVPVVNVKVVLNDPAISDLKMPSVRDLIANSNHDARRLAPFEDHYDCVRLGLF